MTEECLRRMRVRRGRSILVCMWLDQICHGDFGVEVFGGKEELTTLNLSGFC